MTPKRGGRIFFCFLGLLGLGIVLFWSGASAYAAGRRQGRVVMVVIDHLTLEDLGRHVTGNLQRLMHQGAVALLNTTAGGSRVPANTYPTIGAGAHAVGTKAALAAYECSERPPQGGDLVAEFAQRTGYRPRSGNVVVLDIARIVKENAKLEYPVVPGALGGELKAAGLKVACLGNADWRDHLGRQVATIAMDECGVVEAGFVGRELLVQDAGFPGGWRTNYDLLWDKWSRLKTADFIVIDLGDTSRLHEAREEVADPIFRQRWEEALARADAFVGKLAASLDFRRDLLLVVAPTPASEALEHGDWVTLVLMVGRGVPPGTVLVSLSTRRPGVIMNTDIAPTVLEFFGLQVPETMSGRPATAVRAGEQLSFLSDLREKSLFVHNFRVPVIKIYLSYAIAVITGAVLFILAREKELPRRLRLASLLLSVMVVPLAVLLMPGLGAFKPFSYIIGLSVLVAALTLVMVRLERRQPFTGFIFLSAATAGLILADAFTGARLLKTSLLSYDLMGGARFYGIGNEYMGVLISAVIFGSACAFTIWGRRIFPGVLLLMGIATATLGAPGLGANFGGLLTAVVAFPVSLLAFAGIRLTWRSALTVCGVGLLLPALFAACDLLRGEGAQSHVGRNLLLVLQDPGAALDIIKRKMAMNIKLFRYTIWSRVLAAGIGGLLILFYRPVGVMRDFRVRYPYLFNGFTGVVVTAVAAFAFNDSGTVAAAMATIFGIPPLLYILLQEG
ncbi:hypothetical protein [Thermodesulfitimonas sp.]